MVRYTLSSGPREVTRITLVSGTMTGRLVSMCGQMGVRQMAGTDGKIIGPPAESEYAVDPVGVARISPSALYLQTYCASTCTSRSIMRAIELLVRTASFKASKLATTSPERVDRKSTRLNSSHLV